MPIATDCYNVQEVLLWIGTFGCVDSVDLVRLASRMQRGPPTVIAKAKYVFPLSDVFGGSININLVAVNPQVSYLYQKITSIEMLKC